VARTGGERCGRRRDVGVEAARRLKEILKAGSVPPRPLPSLPPPPQFPEERRPLRLLRRTEPDDE